MANLTIENINGFVRSGNLESIFDHGRTIHDSGQKAGVPQADSNQASPTESAAKSFADYLTKSVNEMNEMQLQADHAVKELVAGRNKNIHETMLLLEKADMNLRLGMQIRNKLIDAYREVMRMQI